MPIRTARPRRSEWSTTGERVPSGAVDLVEVPDRASGNRMLVRLDSTPMPLAVDTLELGPVGTNCYLVRADARLAGGGRRRPERRRRRDPAAARGTGRALRRDPRHPRPLGPPRRRRRPGRGHRRAGLHAGRRAVLHSRSPRFTPATRPSPSARTRPTSLLEGGETLDLAGIAFDVLAVPGHSPAHLAYYADGVLFSGDVLFAGGGRPHRPPGRRLETLLGVDPRRSSSVSAGDGRLPGPRAGDDARRRARRATRSSPSSARSGSA